MSTFRIYSGNSALATNRETHCLNNRITLLLYGKRTIHVFITVENKSPESALLHWSTKIVSFS